MKADGISGESEETSDEFSETAGNRPEDTEVPDASKSQISKEDEEESDDGSGNIKDTEDDS